MYECLIGTAPFAGGSDMDVMYQQVHKSITSSHRLSGMPAGMRAFLAKAMDKNPDARFQTAEAMKEQLLKCRIGSKTLVRVPFLGGVGGAVVVAAIAVLALAFCLFYAGSFKQAGKVTKASKHDQSFARIRTAEDLRKKLFSQDMALPEKLHLASNYADYLNSDTGNDKRKLADAKMVVADFYIVSGRCQLAYKLIGEQLKTDYPRGKQRAKLLIKLASSATNSGALNVASKAFLDALKLDPSLKNSAEFYNSSMEFWMLSGQLDKAEEKGMDWLNHYAGPENANYFQRLCLLVKVLAKESNYDLCERIARRGLKELSAIDPATLDYYYPTKNQLLLLLAACYEHQHQYLKSEHLLQDCLASVKENGGQPALEVLSELADFYQRTGQTDKVLPIRKTISASSDVHSGFQVFMFGKMGLANTYLSSGRAAACIEQVWDALEIWKEQGEHCSFSVAESEMLKGQVLDPLVIAYARTKSMREFVKRAEIYVQGLPASGLEKAAWLQEIGQSYYYILDGDRGEAYLRKALDSLSGDAEAYRIVQIRIETQLAAGLAASGKSAEALQIVDPLVPELVRDFPSCLSDLAQAQRVQASVWEDRKEFKTALKLRRDVLALYKKEHPRDVGAFAAVNYELAQTLVKTGDYKAAVPIFEQIVHDLSESKDHLVQCSSARCGFCYLALGDFDSARKCLKSVDKQMHVKIANDEYLTYDNNEVDAIGGFLSRMKAESEKHGDKVSLRCVQQLEALLKKQTRQ